MTACGRKPTTQAAILAALRSTTGSLSAADMARITGKTRHVVHSALYRLRDRGAVKEVGRWANPIGPAQPLYVAAAPKARVGVATWFSPAEALMNDNPKDCT
jgi:hypothetical protein